MSKAMQSWADTDKALILASLAKISASPMFAASPRQQRFLEYIVMHTLDGSTDRLKGYTLGVDVFDRGSDFDPAIDAIVRVEAARLRNKLREYYDGEGRADAVVIDLPKGSYGAEILLRGDLINHPESAPQDTVALTKPPSENLEDHEPTLAVLPFINLSPDPGQDYFVDGIVDSLIFEMSRLSGLLVICRQSSFAYRASTQSSQEIGSALGCKYLLEGSVQRSQQRVRITVTLLEASSGTRLWSERYDNAIQDIFALQDTLARSVARVLQVRLVGAESRHVYHEGTENLEAHDALLRGLECFWKYMPKWVSQARDYFAQATELDANYAAAHAWLARALLYQWILKWDRDDRVRELAFQHAERAVELDGNLPYALAILGWANAWLRRREPAITACRKAVALNPNNADANMFLAFCLSSAGLGEEAWHYIEKALQLNPHSAPLYQYTLGQTYFVLEEYDKAIAALKRGIDISEKFAPNYYLLAGTYAIVGREHEMREIRRAVLAGGDERIYRSAPWLDEGFAATYEHLMQIAGLR